MYTSITKDIRLQSQFLIFCGNFFLQEISLSKQKSVSKQSFKQTAGLSFS